ncbi:MAG: D-xylose ABC transporter substrate-binding protein [Pyrinomonadaceae bacterium MAG19_C2-C3]|nr:D-xylose ABC transporter substrate-binding protein [Pyrinomonadaceae bacterium MAG19_C2-C3]
MRNKFFTLLIALFALVLTACVGAPQEGASTTNTNAPATAANGKIKIGFSMDTLKEERWQRDKELFEQRVRELGGEVLTTVANGSDADQINQCENLLTQGINVLVIVPHNGNALSNVVAAAKRQGVPVIAYDRLIRNADIDLYTSHQVEKMGEMQARYALDKVPNGNYLLIGGSPTDNNAILMRKGQMNVLKPEADAGRIEIVAEPYAREWSADEALNLTENALTQNNNDIQAVVVSNDGTAGGVVQALQAQGLTGKTVVTGQDADLAGLQRIAAGTQTMTIYKPIRPLAYGAAEAAMKLARKEPLDAATDRINNGMKDVPAILHEPVVVDRNNIVSTVVKDGFQTYDKIYANIPAANRPPNNQ